jgi:hypothetical protein
VNSIMAQLLPIMLATAFVVRRGIVGSRGTSGTDRHPGAGPTYKRSPKRPRDTVPKSSSPIANADSALHAKRSPHKIAESASLHPKSLDCETRRYFIFQADIRRRGRIGGQFPVASGRLNPLGTNCRVTESDRALQPRRSRRARD